MCHLSVAFCTFLLEELDLFRGKLKLCKTELKLTIKKNSYIKCMTKHY